MNRFTRLTALLLALMMILSTFAAAETAYQVGDMTTEQWNSIVQNAQSILNEPVINKGGDVIDYPPETPTPSTPYDKTIEVTLGQNQDITTANLAVVKSNVADQWQIAIKDDLWVNILGEDGNTLNVNAAMLQGTALKVRQAGNDAQVTAFTVSEETAAAMQNETTEFSVEPREGTTADTPMTVEDANPDIEKFALQIVYRTATTHVEVASPYTASFVNGSSYSATVRYPVVKGYTPQLSTSAIEGVTLTDNGDSLTYSFTKLTPNAPIEIVVLYNPAKVTYDVNHYQQNTDDDDYKLVATETQPGYTEAETEAAAKQYDGFYALLFDQPTIAADGSTDVNIYYDRHYYLMNFELSGGYGVEPIYARYGATIPPVGTPNRAGYTFIGWSTTENGTVDTTLPEDTMPLNGAKYYAVWQSPDLANLKIIYWGENANDEGYSIENSYVTQVAPGTRLSYEENVTICGKEEHSHTDACYICGEQEAHTHDTSCYVGVGRTTYIPQWAYGLLGDRTDGRVYIGNILGYSFTLIAVDGTWYIYDGNEAHGTIVPPACGKTEGGHVHVDSCANHIEHHHSNECYMLQSGMDTRLWTYVKSDTVTVAADGSTVMNVYFDRTTFVMTFKETSANGNGTIATIEDKWGADIKERFETISEANTFLWSSAATGSSPWTSFVDVMPSENRTYYANRNNSSNVQTATYLGEKLDGSGYEVLYTVEVKYNGNLTVSEEEFEEIEGFQFNPDMSADVGDTYNGSSFYYDRLSFDLIFNDGYNDIETKSVKYEMPLGSYDFTPTLPVDVNGNPVYPPNSVTFGGWYLNKECTGDEYKLSEHIMPAENVLLYAKWVPVDKTVTFYLDLPTLETNGAALGSVTVPYGTKVAEENIPAHEKTGYKFVGWFYVENGEEKAFDFANMPVTKDMEVYGKWTSDTMVPYRVRYVYVENGVETPVAADETGSAPGGSTETFDAKVGAELYDDYQKGYFPTLTKSHNVLMEVVKDANGVVQEVVYTFYYYKRDAVPYVVYYVDSAGKELLDPYVNTGNVESIVSETFKPITGYMPDEFQKSLVVNGDNDTSVQWITVPVNGVSVQVHPDNVITFVYSKNETEALYVMSYHMEELDGSYTLYARENAQVGTVDQEYSNKPLETVPEGFSYEKTVVVTSAGELVNETTEKQISAVLTTAGLEFKHYYKRNLYPYTVHYYKQGTTESVYASKTVSDNKYGQKVPETARDLTPAYSLVSLPEASITIGIGENVIIFEYAENDVLIQYEAVGLAEEQKASALTSTGETLPAVSGNAEGSIAKEILGYTFDGWYTDEACEQAVGEDDGIVSVVTDPTVGTKFTPLKEAATEQLPGGYYSDAVFYAKYTEQTATITYIAVRKTGENEYTEDANGGTVNVLGNATSAGAVDSETVTVVTGNVAGAKADPKDNYKFLGWFTKDDNGKYVAIENGSELEYLPVKGDIWQDATYYALFELDVADLTITKKVNNAKDGTVAPVGDEFTFQVELPDGEYTYTVDGTVSDSKLVVQGGKGELSIKANEVVVIKDVVIKSQYKVAEVKKHDYFEASNSVEGQIAATGSTAEITNTYLTGKLVIEKRVTSDNAPDDTFTMNVTLTLPNTTGATLPTSYNVSYSNSEATGTSISSAGGTITLVAGQTATISGLPYGTKYTVTEAEMTYYTGTVNPSGEQEIENAIQEVEVTNTYNTGTLVITKTVVGNAPADEFAITVWLTLPNGLTTLPNSVKYKRGEQEIKPDSTPIVLEKVTNGETITISGLPVGTQYAVLETEKPAYYEPTGEVAASENKAIAADTISTVSIINSYKSGNLQITKAVTPTSAGATLPTEDKFTIVVTLTKPEGSKVDWNSTPVVCTIQNGAEGARYTVKDDTITFTGIVKDSVINITGLPAGTTYTITEAETYPSYYTKAGEITTPVAIVAGQTAEVTLTNTYHTCNLVVEKEVVSANAGTTAPDDVFELKVTFGLPTDHGATAQLPTSYTKTDKNGNTSTVNFTVANGVVTISNVKAGDKFTFNNLPAGTTYKVEESTSPSYYTKSGEVTTATPIADGSTKTVKITNTYYAGSLMVKKNVTSDPTVTTLPDERFAIDVKIELPANSGTALTLASIQSSITKPADVEVNLEGNVFHFTNVANASEIHFGNLPYGTQYTVTEITPPGYYDVAIDNGNATIGEQNQKPKVTITNTYKTGTLKITKKVEGNAPADEFAITVTLTLPNGMTDLPGSVQYEKTAGKYTVSGGTVTYTVGATGGNLAISGLPVGTTYTVTESTPPSYYTSDIRFADDNKAITNASEVDEVTVTNTYNTGSLTVTKSVTSNPAVATLPQDTFTIDVELELPKDNEAKVSLDHIAINKPDSVVLTLTSGGFQFTNVVDGAQIVLDNLPHGTKYTVTEINVPGYYEVTYTGSNTNIIDAKTQDSATKDTTVAITNTYLTGSLEITKVVDGTGMPEGDTFEIQVAFTRPPVGNAALPTQYKLNSETTLRDINWTGTVAKFAGIVKDDKITIAGIPYYTTYEVTETYKPGYYSDQVIFTYSDTVNKHIDSSEDTVEVKNTYQTGSLTVTKKVEKPFDGKLTAEYPTEFQFTLALTDAAGNPVNATVTATGASMEQNANTCTFSLQNNGSITLSGVPHGVKYTVTEDSTSIANYYTTTVSVNGAEATSGYVGSGTMDATANTVDDPATVAYVNTARTSDLTIEKNGMNSTNESAIVEVTVAGKIYMVVLNNANHWKAVIAGLPIGATYSATETSWTWRYTGAVSGNGAISKTEGTSKITVSNSPNGDKWLHDESVEHNVFGTTITTTEGGEQ